MKRIGPLKIAIIYVTVSLLWIFFSDQLLFLFREKLSPHLFLILNSGKGFFFVAITGIGIYILTRSNNSYLVKNEKEYRNLYEHNPNPMWLYDIGTLKYISVNDAAVQFYGYSREEFLNMTLWDIRPAEEHPKLEQAVKELHNHRKSGIWKHLKKDGSVVYVDITSNKIEFLGYDAVMVLARDCTDSIKLEHELMDTNHRLNDEKKRLSDAQDLSKVAGWDYYVTDNQVRLSDEVYKIFNTTPAILKPEYDYLTSLVHRDDLDQVLLAKDVTINTGVDFDIVHRIFLGKDNIKFIRQLGKLEYRDNVPYKIRGTMQDITELKLIEFEKTRIDNENKRLGTIITKINNMVIILDADSRITWVNKAYEQLTGYTLSEITGLKPSQFMTGPETGDVVDYITEQQEKQATFAVEIMHYTKAKQKYWANIEFTPLFDDYGCFSGYITIHNNITARREKEDEITKQNTLLKNIAWLSSHEIRRPVASILGLMELIKNTTDHSEKEEYIGLLNECTLQLDDIIHKISYDVHKGNVIDN